MPKNGDPTQPFFSGLARYPYNPFLDYLEPFSGLSALYHGFSNLVLPLLLHGIPLVLAPSPLPEVLRAAASNMAALTLPAVPALWRTWLDAGAIPRAATLAISAGAPLPLALEHEIFAKLGLKVHNFYGSTECGGIAFDRSPTPRQDPASAGEPLDNVHLAVNPEGCLEVRGTAVGQTYWPEPHPTLADGRFQTTDLACLQDGQVLLHGRASDVINVAGRKIAPEIIEHHLLAHPGVRECLVFGVPHAPGDRGDSIVAVVATAANPAELREFLLRRLAGWQVPRLWWVQDRIQTNERGKLSRTDWRRKFLAQKPPIPIAGD